MDAFLNNARAIEDDNAVRQAHGTQAVSDGEGGAHPYRRDTRRCHEYPSDVHSEVFIALDPIRRCSEIRSRQRNSPIGLQIAPNRLVNLCREPMLNGYSPDCAAGAANRKVAPIARVRGFFVERRANMARFLRIRHVVKTDRPSAHEQIQASCGIKPDGSHWSLTQNEAISQVEEGTSIFYVERAGGRRLDVIVAMDLHAHKYLKTVADGQQPDELFYLPNCPNVAHEISRSARAGR